MNCQEFEQIVAEFADYRLASVKTRITAITHAANCEHCDAQLRAQKALNQSLVGLAEHTGDQQSPLRLRQSLRAAFETQQAELAVKESSPNVLRLANHQSVVRRRWVWGMAAAAAALLVFALVLSSWQNRRQSETFVVAVTPAPTATPDSTAQPEAPANHVAEQALKSAASALRAAESPNHKRQARSVTQRQTANQPELAANYIPLSYAAGSATPDQSLVVRVNVPRTTLIAMGLPLSAERGSEMVKADLRVGIDGVPLAIRLVRQ